MVNMAFTESEEERDVRNGEKTTRWARVITYEKRQEKAVTWPACNSRGKKCTIIGISASRIVAADIERHLAGKAARLCPESGRTSL